MGAEVLVEGIKTSSVPMNPEVLVSSCR